MMYPEIVEVTQRHRGQGQGETYCQNCGCGIGVGDVCHSVVVKFDSLSGGLAVVCERCVVGKKLNVKRLARVAR